MLDNPVQLKLSNSFGTYSNDFYIKSKDPDTLTYIKKFFLKDFWLEFDTKDMLKIENDIEGPEKTLYERILTISSITDLSINSASLRNCNLSILKERISKFKKLEKLEMIINTSGNLISAVDILPPLKNIKELKLNYIITNEFNKLLEGANLEVLEFISSKFSKDYKFDINLDYIKTLKLSYLENFPYQSLYEKVKDKIIPNLIIWNKEKENLEFMFKLIALSENASFFNEENLFDGFKGISNPITKNLTLEGFEKISFNELNEFEYLESLTLISVCFTSYKQFEDFLKTSKTLKSLILKGYPKHADDIHLLKKGLISTKSLKYLFISEGYWVSCLADFLEFNKDLEEIEIQKNMDDETLKIFFKSLQKNSTLKKISLPYQQISNRCINDLDDLLIINHTLIKFIMNPDTNLTGLINNFVERNLWISKINPIYQMRNNDLFFRFQ